VAAQSVLGVSEVRPPLLDDLSHATRGGPGSARTTTQASDPVISRTRAMHLMPDIDDEEDEVFEDEEFDEDSESDEDDEDLDEENGEEEETWQVCRVLTS
jgi:hypothetical protein